MSWLPLIVTIVGWIVKYPIDQLWKKYYDNPQPTNRVFLKIAQFLFGYLLPISSVVYATIYNPLDKIYVLTVAICIFAIFLHVQTDDSELQNRINKNHNRSIKELQDRFNDMR